MVYSPAQRTFPYQKFINFLRDRHNSLYSGVVNGTIGTKDALARIETTISIGETLDSPVCLDDEMENPAKLLIYNDEHGRPHHWVYWLGFWNDFCDEPFWPLSKTIQELPLVVDIMQVMEMPE